MTRNLVLTDEKRFARERKQRVITSRGSCVRRQERAQRASCTAVNWLWLVHAVLAGCEEM